MPDIAVLGIDADHDEELKLGLRYREFLGVYRHFESNGSVVTKLQGEYAKREFVCIEARKPEVKYITGLGHGGPGHFTGQNKEIIYRIRGTAQNPPIDPSAYDLEEVQGKIIHFLSCYQARGLGVDLVANGCKAYFGYAGYFGFCPHNPIPFFLCDSEIDRGFANGATAEQVFARVERLFLFWIDFLWICGEYDASETLNVNFSLLRCPSKGDQLLGHGAYLWGDPDASLA